MTGELYLDIYSHIANTSLEAYIGMLNVPEFARSTLGCGNAKWQRRFTVKYTVGLDYEWRLRGLLHRDGGPAVVRVTGDYQWYQHGLLHRDGGPAVEYADHAKYWYRCGELHRDDGPAIEMCNGAVSWYQHGVLHRVGGPAVEYDNVVEWWLHGKMQRKTIRGVVPCVLIEI
jgi:hypothetical protein